MREWLNVKQVASMLGVSRITLYRYIKKGLIPYYRISRRYLFDPKDVERVISDSKYNIKEAEKNPEIIYSEF